MIESNFLPLFLSFHWLLYPSVLTLVVQASMVIVMSSWAGDDFAEMEKHAQIKTHVNKSSVFWSPDEESAAVFVDDITVVVSATPDLVIFNYMKSSFSKNTH